MRKYIISIIALTAALASCSKDAGFPKAKAGGEQSESLPGVRYETLVIKTGNIFKSVLNGTTCSWSENDSFKVYSDLTGYSSANTFVKNAGENSFAGQVPEGTTDFYAVYASQQRGSYSDGRFVAQVTIPNKQSPVLDSFDPAAHVAMAHGTRGTGPGTDITFRTVNRLIQLTVPANVTSVTFSSSTAIAGAVTIVYDGADAAMDGTAGSSSVTLSNGGKVIPEGTYYLCVAPVDMAGFQMTYTFTDGSTYTRSSKKTLAMAASNQIRNLTLDFADLLPAVAISGCLTSYNYAAGDGVGKDIDAANAMDNDTVGTGLVSISGTDGWSGYSYGYNDGTDHDGVTDIPASSKSEWKEYAYYGYMKVAGRTIRSETLRRHITGLPYNRDNLRIENFKNDWTINTEASSDMKWQNSYLYLRKKSTTTFRGFHLPEPMEVTVSYSLSTYGSSLLFRQMTKMTVGDQVLVDRDHRGTASWVTDSASSDVMLDSSRNTILIETSTTSGGGATWISTQSCIEYIGAVYK